ncbi:phage holin family protein [Aneurinibacillus sp. Ricciae_BoGa-3]|uniref:phage holin family protein n=1 Tax=Aneurinibacillus sp. Ricciae_BoGa-3 TaxID=3022697 RepID=UPI002341F166|nr:phage holin family protein [Aneurinibacillus sp. Ricciae_BoGa-3]WCK56385.1 phage holin family protein [Aneurinibacillus sp. Ricciae_BoGa-3]
MEEISKLISDVTLDPALLGVIPALLVLGTILKITPKCPDWIIAWIILFAGIASGIATVGFSVRGIANGMIAAGSAIGTHQLWKQTTKRQ